MKEVTDELDKPLALPRKSQKEGQPQQPQPSSRPSRSHSGWGVLPNPFTRPTNAKPLDPKLCSHSFLYLVDNRLMDSEPMSYSCGLCNQKMRVLLDHG